MKLILCTTHHNYNHRSAHSKLTYGYHILTKISTYEFQQKLAVLKFIESYNSSSPSTHIQKHAGLYILKKMCFMRKIMVTAALPIWKL